MERRRPSTRVKSQKETLWPPIGKVIHRLQFATACLSGCQSILKIGCAEVGDIPLLARHTSHILAVDMSSQRIHRLKKSHASCSFRTLDITDESPLEIFDGAISLDLLDQIPDSLEHRFVSNICQALRPEGLLVLGVENTIQKPDISARLSGGKLNPKEGKDLLPLLAPYFDTVSLFTWTGEEISPGYQEAGAYCLAIAQKPKLSQATV